MRSDHEDSDTSITVIWRTINYRKGPLPETGIKANAQAVFQLFYHREAARYVECLNSANS